MKQRRFSDQELFAIRNHISIKMVIEDILCIPSKISHGAFRFQCPLCDKFNTAINHRTNLARCFLCKKNFNPIDIVMAVKKMTFVETVNLLKKYKNNLSSNKKQAPQDTSSPSINAGTPVTWHKACKDMVVIGDTLPDLMRKDKTEKQRIDKADSYAPSPQLPNIITNLEQNIQFLSQQIEQLKTTINNQNRQ
ncbi:MAG: hypothetical protein U9N62_02005 [Thermotogota bacterium]|nr:hypothetical protein [Thermotogota bacterium]